LKFYLLLLTILLNLEANYCIQVITTDTTKKDFIIQKASSEEYSPFSDVRVERIGNYLVLRIGDYTSYRYASSVARRVKEISDDAYVRTCNFTRSNAIYLHNNSKEDNNYYDAPQPTQNYTVPHYTKPQPKKRVQKEYKKKEELSYRHIDRDNSLWNDCKKCFIPVYEEEDEENLKEQKQTRPKHHVEEKRDTFWEEDIPDLSKYRQEAELKPKPRKKNIRNKFNIDEQFLP